MTDIIKAFVEDARDVSIEEAAKILGLKFRRSGKEHPQPCPISGGTDRFSFNTEKNSWNCRGCGTGGKDAIGMAAHQLDLDVRQRPEFLEACAAVLARPVPDEGTRESDDDRDARLARIEERRRESERQAEVRQRQQVDFREAERRKARGLYEAAGPIAGTPGHDYFEWRCSAAPDGRALRFSPDLPYWHGDDGSGRPDVLHSGPAIIAPFIDRHLQIIGCHITWIDLRQPPKYRPLLYALTAEGLRAGRRTIDGRQSAARPSAADISAGYYEVLPTKKMRGSKKGGLIPIAGRISAARWVGGEGIENGVAFAGWEGFRDDSFYFAAGDLGNLAGPADPSSRFAHPTLTKVDRNGVARPVMIAGPVPRADQGEEDAMWVADHVAELVLLCDGDSERVMTAAAMARARKRHSRPGRTIPLVWPQAGADFSKMAAEARA